MFEEMRKHVQLLESLEQGQEEEKVEYDYGYDEDEDMWMVYDGSDKVYGHYPTEGEAKGKVESLSQQPYKISESEEEETDEDMEAIDESHDDTDLDSEEYEPEETFWDAFEKDVDFHIHEANDAFCVLGDDTNFHYGTHVTKEMAEEHIMSLKSEKEE